MMLLLENVRIYDDDDDDDDDDEDGGSDDNEDDDGGGDDGGGDDDDDDGGGDDDENKYSFFCKYCVFIRKILIKSNWKTKYEITVLQHDDEFVVKN